MALLKVETRKKWMKYLGYEYNEKGILAMQKDYFVRKKDQDGKYGPDSDKLLRHLHHVKKYMPNFKPQEFRCGCGGRYCTGYPTWLRVKECKHIQAIRSHYKKPMIVTSGLRCRRFNAQLSGSSSESRHLKGRAVDFYIAGVTDTLAHRKKAVKYIKKLKNHHYTYGNGINSYGYAVYAPNMGNAMHSDVN